MNKQAFIACIADLVPFGSRVLDLGCGDGELLSYLQQSKGCSGYGVEIDDENVLECVKRGVQVIQLNLDQGLTMFEDACFDVVLQIDTLQNLRNAETMLVETVRVGELGIVAFPNFAHWPNRLSILQGRMPNKGRDCSRCIPRMHCRREEAGGLHYGIYACVRQ